MSESIPSSLQSDLAREAYHADDFSAAATHQAEAVEVLTQAGRPSHSARLLLALYQSKNGDSAQAAELLEELIAEAPDEPAAPQQAQSSTDTSIPEQPFFIFGMKNGGCSYLQTLLDLHPATLCPPEQNLNSLWKRSDRSAQTYEKLLARIDDSKAQQGTHLDAAKIRDDLYATWLRHLFSHYHSNTQTHVGLVDTDLDTNLNYHRILIPSAKFVFVVRDPRDIAVALWSYKKEHETGYDRDGSRLDAMSHAVGLEWLAKVERVKKFHQEHSDRIELVRYEDLRDPERSSKALRRIMNFLDLDYDEETTDYNHKQLTLSLDIDTSYTKALNVGMWRDALSMTQIGNIQSVAGNLMATLEYPICDTSQRSASEDDTILPS